MTIDKILSELYRKHTVWILMAEKLLPVYKITTAEDVVQSMYIKIYEKLEKKKLTSADIIIEGKPHYGIIYITLRDIVASTYRKNKTTFPLTTEIELKESESEAEFYEKIDNIVEGFQWFHKKLFKLYSKEFRSLRKLSDATKISYKVVCKTVKECKEEIKKQVNGK